MACFKRPFKSSVIPTATVARKLQNAGQNVAIINNLPTLFGPVKQMARRQKSTA
jgi:hypothetical protein